ncbi:4990_t:CDS:1, partial [Gigaspora rosea]
KIKSLTETSVEFITNNMVIYSDEELSDEDSDPMSIQITSTPKLDQLIFMAGM